MPEAPATESEPTGPARLAESSGGLVQGGLGGSERQLLEDGQEEVFARDEVESGRIEHATDAGGGNADR